MSAKQVFSLRLLASSGSPVDSVRGCPGSSGQGSDCASSLVGTVSGFYSILFVSPRRMGPGRSWASSPSFCFVKVVSIRLVIAALHQGDFLASLDVMNVYLHILKPPEILCFAVGGGPFSMVSFPFGGFLPRRSSRYWPGCDSGGLLSWDVWTTFSYELLRALHWWSRVYHVSGSVRLVSGLSRNQG